MKVVVGYSGGLDTSVIVPWLKENYNAEVVCMSGHVGQREGLGGLEEEALARGAVEFYGEDLRREFVEDFVWPTLKIGAVYGHKYLLGTAMARPILGKRQVEIARAVGADALAHGCTVDETKLFSRDENLWHISHEGGPLEDPGYEPEESMFLWTVTPELAPDKPEGVEVSFEAGVPVAVNGKTMGAVELLEECNDIAARNGVGRADLVENRLVGMKSRGVYETPGGTLLYKAIRDLESITIDREAEGLKDQMADRWANMVYEGRWWTPEREALQAMSDVLSRNVTGSVKLKLFKGSCVVTARTSPVSLYDEDLASFGGSTKYDQSDASGFIRLFGLPTRAAARQKKEAHELDQEIRMDPPARCLSED